VVIDKEGTKRLRILDCGPGEIYAKIISRGKISDCGIKKERNLEIEELRDLGIGVLILWMLEE